MVKFTTAYYRLVQVLYKLNKSTLKFTIAYNSLLQVSTGALQT